jgi:hypothetical protein
MGAIKVIRNIDVLFVFMMDKYAYVLTGANENYIFVDRTVSQTQTHPNQIIDERPSLSSEALVGRHARVLSSHPPPAELSVEL